MIVTPENNQSGKLTGSDSICMIFPLKGIMEFWNN